MDHARPKDGTSNPGNLSVSNSGLIAFDNDRNGPARVYDGVRRRFVDIAFGGRLGRRVLPPRRRCIAQMRAIDQAANGSGPAVVLFDVLAPG